VTGRSRPADVPYFLALRAPKGGSRARSCWDGALTGPEGHKSGDSAGGIRSVCELLNIIRFIGGLLDARRRARHAYGTMLIISP